MQAVTAPTGRSERDNARNRPFADRIKPRLTRFSDIGEYQLRQSVNLKRGPLRRIFVAGGGCGSTFMVSSLRKSLYKVHVRPDTAFSFKQDLDAFPSKENISQFYERSGGFWLNERRSINDNLVAYIEHLEQGNGLVLLSRLSRLGNFLTRNGLSQSVCLVRHPLHAYVSFLGHRHPNTASHLGGLESTERIRWYARQWNLMAADYIDSGASIIRFEHMQEDAREVSNPNLGILFKRWRSGLRNYDVLPADRTRLLEDLVAENYYKLYHQWEI